jgi:ATP-dependent Zn protease
MLPISKIPHILYDELDKFIVLNNLEKIDDINGDDKNFEKSNKESNGETNNIETDKNIKNKNIENKNENENKYDQQKNETDLEFLIRSCRFIFFLLLLLLFFVFSFFSYRFLIILDIASFKYLNVYFYNLS